MKPCRTFFGAIAWAFAGGIIGGLLCAIVMLPLGPDGPPLGAVMGALPAGLFTLLVKYPRWESDL